MTTTLAPDLKPNDSESQGWPTLAPDLGDTMRGGPVAPPFDPTQGRKRSSDPYDDPTQGRKIGSHPKDDPTRARYPPERFIWVGGGTRGAVERAWPLVAEFHCDA